MELIFAALAEVIINDLAQQPRFVKWREQLQGGSPEKRALEESLKEAYRLFCKKYPDISNSFFDQHLLDKSEFRVEITKLLTPDQNPDLATLEQIWKEQFSWPPNLSVSEPIRYFIDTLQANITSRPEFKPNADSRNLARIAASAERTANSLEQFNLHSLNPDSRKYELQYLNHLLNDYKEVEETYTPLEGTSTQRNSPKKPAKNIHPDVGLAFELRKQINSTLNVSSTTENTIDDIIYTTYLAKQVVILGEPGSGKTTVLRKCCLTMVTRAIEDITAPLPVMIPLGALPIGKMLSEEIQKTLGTNISLIDLISKKRIAYIFDGLNELPKEGLEGWKKEITEIVSRAQRDETVIAVTCRELDYSSLDLDVATQIRIKPLDPPRIMQFCLRYFSSENDALELFWKLAGGTGVRSMWEELEKEGVAFQDFWTDEYLPQEIVDIQREILGGGNWIWRRVLHPRLMLSLACNPYMLFMIIQVFSVTGDLPKNRGVLFDVFTKSLMAREKLSNTRSEELRTKLAELSFEIQKQKKGTSVDRSFVLDRLNEQDLHIASSASFLEGYEQIRFSHQLLQEYFAASYLRTKLDEGANSSEFFPPDSWWERQGWEETFLLLAGLYNDDATAVVNWLKDTQPELAANCITDSGASVPQTVIEGLRPSWMRRLISESESTQARAAIGRGMGLLNLDNRLGILAHNGKPDIIWCEIEPGEAVIGGDPNVLDVFYPREEKLISFDYPYWVSKYPITVAQFQPFVEEGYEKDQYWTTAGLLWRGNKSAPAYWLKPDWHISNHPVVGITWYEAVAYSNWLTEVIYDNDQLVERGYIVRLPSEAEWEKAARGSDHRFFSYGNDALPDAANNYSKLPEPVLRDITIYSEDNLLDNYLEDLKRVRFLDRTSAVGIFPQDISPYGVVDICGNVWEWTVSEWKQTDSSKNVDQFEGNQKRILKGGSWEFNSNATRCASRGRSNPFVTKPTIGFRVCIGPIVPEH